ncbi:MAG: gliding motility protein GldD [Tannerella sp.]|nr:gliding motility protein GldD [Tannerella sp.]
MRNVVFILLFTCTILLSCKKNHTPKPRGYLRIEPPAAQYVAFNMDELPYGFNISTQTAVEMSPGDNDSLLYRLNIDYPDFRAKIYCSYQSITPQTFHENDDECRRLVERTVRNADAVNEKVYEDNDRNIYGVLFLIEGQTASPVQFMLTDSTSHFFRGALYYKDGSNADSLAPVTEYIKKDIIELIQSFYWKK